eukprot:scaffold222206_cov19-Tisochrysis_lutea.AAC.1
MIGKGFRCCEMRRPVELTGTRAFAGGGIASCVSASKRSNGSAHTPIIGTTAALRVGGRASTRQWTADLGAPNSSDCSCRPRSGARSSSLNWRSCD